MTKLPIEKGWTGKGRDIFCENCLTHERHFKGGGSWSPDLCPCGCEDTIVWYKISMLLRGQAQKVYDKNERNGISKY